MARAALTAAACSSVVPIVCGLSERFTYRIGRRQPARGELVVSAGGGGGGCWGGGGRWGWDGGGAIAGTEGGAHIACIGGAGHIA